MTIEADPTVIQRRNGAASDERRLHNAGVRPTLTSRLVGGDVQIRLTATEFDRLVSRLKDADRE